MPEDTSAEQHSSPTKPASESPLERWTKPIVTTVIASLITFVATYYFARASKVTVWYSIATTALGTDGSLQDLVPGISITVGEEDVPALTVHEVQILPGSGTHVDKGTLAIDFDRPTRMYGEVLAFAPTSAHQIECSGVAVGDGKLFAEDTRFSGVACDSFTHFGRSDFHHSACLRSALATSNRTTCRASFTPRCRSCRKRIG